MGYRIKETREGLGMTQMQLAKRSGVSRATICALESGMERTTTTKTLEKLAEAMNTTFDKLFAVTETHTA